MVTALPRPVHRRRPASALPRIVAGPKAAYRAGVGTTHSAPAARRRALFPVPTVATRPGATKVAGTKKPQKKPKGTKTGASLVTKKQRPQIGRNDQGGGVSPVTNGPGFGASSVGDLSGGLIDSITGSVLGAARLAVIAILIYLAWKYGRKYLK